LPFVTVGATGALVAAHRANAASLMDEAISKLPDADAFRATTTLDAVRRELKARGGDAFLNARLLLSSLARRVAPGRAPPSEEIVIGVLDVLCDFSKCMDEELLAGVAPIIADAVPFLTKEKPRRAAKAAIAALTKRLPSAATRVSDAIVTKGLRSDNVRLALVACAHALNPSHPHPPS
jgi:hypothetical protein